MWWNLPSQAFCSGGDVKSAVLQAQSGQQEQEAVSAFFDAEYALDLRIARYKLPYIALIDGIVMGGGAGLCMHGHFRVATERCEEGVSVRQAADRSDEGDFVRQASDILGGELLSEHTAVCIRE